MAENINFGTISLQIKASAKEAAEEVKKLSTNIGGLRKALSLVNFAGFVAGIRRISQSISGIIEGTSEYISTVNGLRTVMGGASKEAEEFADKAERILGFDANEIMQSVSGIKSLASGFGIAEKSANKMSIQLTQVAADMSRLKGERFDLALQRIKSGISGELEPMRKWGIALDQVSLQQLAVSLGINRIVTEMTRAQKAELAYYQIMQSTAYAQGYAAKTLITPASALQVVQTEFKRAARAIGSVFIPIVMKIIPYVRALTQILTELAQKLANAFGYKLEDYTTKNTDGVVSGLEDIKDEAEKTEKAMKKMLMPFDELNNVNFDTGSSNTGVGSGGSLGLNPKEYDMFANAAKDINDKVEEIKGTFEKLKPVLETVAGVLVGLWAVDKIVTFIEWLEKVKGHLREIGIAAGIVLTIVGIKTVLEGVKEGDWSKILLGTLETGFGAAITVGLLKKSWTLGLSIAAITITILGLEILAKGIKEDDWIEKIKGALITGTGTGVTIGLISKNWILGLKVGLLITVGTLSFAGGWSLGQWLNDNYGDSYTWYLDKFNVDLTNGIQIEDVPGIAGTILGTIGEAILENSILVKFGIWLGKFIKKGFQKAKDAIVKAWDNVIGWFKDIKKKASLSIGTKWNDIKAKWNDLIGKFKDKVVTVKVKLSAVIEDIKKWINEKFIDKVNDKLPSWMGQIPRLATGGFVNQGQIFIANESGPELVGNIGAKTAVANQKQITEGIAEATYSAFTRAFAENKGNSEMNPYFVINLGEDRIYNGYAKKRNQESNMYGVTL